MPKIPLDVSDLSQRIKPSAIRVLTAEFAKLEKETDSNDENKRCISFGLGEPYVNIPNAAIQGSSSFLSLSSIKPIKYPPNNGISKLRDSIATYLKRFQLDYSSSEILVTNGGREAILLAFLSTLNKGDKLIVPTPCWVAYPELAKLRLDDKDIIFLPTWIENNFVPRTEDLEQLVTNTAKSLASRNRICLQLTDPHNPTGIAFPDAVKKQLAALAIKDDLTVFSDEIYSGLVPKYKSVASYPGMRERSVVFGGVAKVFSMTAWAVGFLATGSKDVYNFANTLKGHASISPAITQEAAAASYSDPEFDTYTKKNRELFVKKARIVNEWADNHGLPHSNTAEGMIYTWISVASTGLSGDEFSREALKCHVLVIPGSGFTDPRADAEPTKYIRIALSATSGDLEQGLKRLESLVS